VKAIKTSFWIVESLRKQDGVGVTGIAREMGIAKSGVYKHLQTLVYLGYLYQDDGCLLSNQFRRLTASAGNQIPIEHAHRPR